MLVKLPGGRTLAVDAKAPLSAYLDAEEAADPAARAAALDRHAQQLWRHVMDLSTREYWAQFDPAPEMVVLFLPGEHFMSAALERNRDLLEAALAKKVLLATPVTLVSILKGVSYGWRQERWRRMPRSCAGSRASFMSACARSPNSTPTRAAIWPRRSKPTTARPDRGTRGCCRRSSGCASWEWADRPSLRSLRGSIRQRASRSCRKSLPESVPHDARACSSIFRGSQALRRWMEAWPPSHKVTRRFVAGDTLEEALAVCERLQSEGIFSTLDHLGENVTTLEEAVRVLRCLRERAGADRGPAACRAPSRSSSRSSAWIFRSRPVWKTSAVWKRKPRPRAAGWRSTWSRAPTPSARWRWRSRPARNAAACGCASRRICIAAPRDIDRLNAAAVPVRLVKGAYREPPSVAFPRKQDVDANYVALMKNAARSRSVSGDRDSR